LILLSFRRRRYSSKPRHGPPGEPIKAEGRTRTFLKSLFNLKKKKNSKNQVENEFSDLFKNAWTSEDERTGTTIYKCETVNAPEKEWIVMRGSWLALLLKSGFDCVAVVIRSGLIHFLQCLRDTWLVKAHLVNIFAVTFTKGGE
jgi:hypothetical protein